MTTATFTKILKNNPMKILKGILRFSLVALCCGLVVVACNPDELEVAPATENPADPAVVAALDGISDKLRFFGATKMQGKAPAAPSVSSLKFSLKDMLYLLPGIPMPIKFLHTGGTQNVAGVYVQVYNASTGAQYHFKVPERPSESDSISVVLVGFESDSTGLAPFGGGVPPPSWAGAEDDFEIEITPYDESGQPIDIVTVPVEVVESNNDADSPTAPDLCGLVNEGGSWWEWVNSWVLPVTEDFEFFGPEYVFKFGTTAKGCCINGVSEYSPRCLGTTSERTLSFKFFTQYAYESIHFHNNGNYARVTESRSNKADIENSDFCNDSGEGAVTPTKVSNVTQRGTWSISSAPQNTVTSGTTALTTIPKSLSPPAFSGFDSVEGIIHQLTCDSLVLLKLDSDLDGGGENHQFTFYQRIRPNEEVWHAL
jgi:hypothetical protein